MAATLRLSDPLPRNLPPRSQPLQISSSLKPFFPHPPLSPLSEPLASLSSSLSPPDPHLPTQTTYFPLGPVFLLQILLPRTLLSLLHPQIQNQQHPLFQPLQAPSGRKADTPSPVPSGPRVIAPPAAREPGHGRTLGILPTLPPRVITLTSLASPRLSCSLYSGQCSTPHPSPVLESHQR